MGGPIARRGFAIAALGLVLEPAWVHLYTLVRLFAARLTYPMDLEWMESGHLYHAYRVLHGLPIYIDPARGFAAFPYPPLFWVVIAGLGRLVGLDYATARAISVGSIAGIVAIFSVLLIRRAPARWVGVAFALVAAAGAAAGYPMSVGSYDLARTDAFATFLPVAAAAVLGDGKPSSRRLLGTAALVAASIYAKQTGVFFAVWLIGFAVIRNWRRGLLLAVAAGTPCVLLFAILWVDTGGWFAVWLFDMRHHPVLWSATLEPLTVFVRQAPLLLVLPLAIGWAHRRGSLLPETSKWVGMLGAAVGSALLAHVKAGGWPNLYVPVFALAWPVSLLVACDVLRNPWLAQGQRTRALGATWVVLGASAAILFELEYDPRPFTPTAAQRRAVSHFRELLRELDGEVVVTTIPFAAVRDGKTCAQPILQGYVDAANAGMPVSFADALDVSGARWVIVTGVFLEDGLGAPFGRKFERVRELDLDLDSPGVAHPFPRTLWRRRGGGS